MFNNIPTVTKNLLILNILFFAASLVMLQNGIDSMGILGGHYLNSPLFEPYQIVTHFFMHSPTDFFHILFNMIMLVMFGGHLERIWGPKRYFIFYIAAALGAFALYNSIGVFQIMELKSQIQLLGYDIYELNDSILTQSNFEYNIDDKILLTQYASKIYTPMVGASGAIFGLMAAFAFLFPNTEMMLLFPPIPIKAKYLIGVYFLLEVYLSFQNKVGDNVAHIAHVGGAIVGFILVFIWNKKKDRFY
ncbi:MAG: rhomboid family intramembrane serine protease [Flavobacteriia bacterium]|jgi:membrane associated rhomboid family serine protease